MLENVRIVLVNTSHSGNIGSVARAMKVMGLKSLFLVNPLCEIDDKTKALASSANDIANNAVKFDSLEDAVQDCHLVVGASARSRNMRWPLLEPANLAEKSMNVINQNKKVAIVFGNERVGLTNEEIEHCNYQMIIPANPEYSSLNLAMAVQITSYEIWKSYISKSTNKVTNNNLQASNQEFNLLFEHLISTLDDVGFLQKSQGNTIQSKLKKIFIKADLEEQEVNILRGVLSSINKFTK